MSSTFMVQEVESANLIGALEDADKNGYTLQGVTERTEQRATPVQVYTLVFRVNRLVRRDPLLRRLHEAVDVTTEAQLTFNAEPSAGNYGIRADAVLKEQRAVRAFLAVWK